ncbi:MAG TPA: putative Fe-S cluster assembly protein SufT [Candidatus Angelobacter sp.]|nr:putative Fe-S cluster assembly protein SufT [Candidatus Angelobacter sp.]
MHTESVTLSRSCEVMEIPSGIPHRIPAGVPVRIMQKLGGSYTVMASDSGCMYRIDAKDADALGFAVAISEPAPESAQGELTEKMVWDQLRTVYDPEIPVNIVDLGLIYSCVIGPHETGGHVIDVKMTMTAPGCGMGGVLKDDAERKLSKLPDVAAVRAEIVFEPQWHPGLMSDAAKLQLGLDVDDSPSTASPATQAPR